MTDKPRFIEFAFPLEQASLDSVHEKNVRHGHISTLHIWPARRPLAASRAALIATLLPDPAAEPKPENMSPAEWEAEVRLRRRELSERIGGRVVTTIERKKMPNGTTVERKKKQTEGGILHWIGTEPSSGGRRKIDLHKREVADRRSQMDAFRQQIRDACGGKPPRVLDPFAGGGAIPLEAMRLGCEVTAADINPVAWFILKCTLEYPQRLAGKTLPLPDFILQDEQFMEDFYKAHPHLAGRTRRTTTQRNTPGLFDAEESDRAPRASLSWHVRAWGRKILDAARRDLAQFYPAYAEFEPTDPKASRAYEHEERRLVPIDETGHSDIDRLNREFGAEYLADPRNPRWIEKPAIAYLWARTATCKNCRATIPLLKTRWLAKSDRTRAILTAEPNADGSGVRFGIESNVPVKGGNTAQRRENDRRLGAGTMSRSGAQCVCCPAIMTLDDLRVEGKAGRLGVVATAVVSEGKNGKTFRVPSEVELERANAASAVLDQIYSDIPHGLPTEPTPAGGGSGAGRAFSVQNYGLMRWCDLFTPRQLVAAGVIAKEIRRVTSASMPRLWANTVEAMLFLAFDRFINYMSTVCIWEPKATEVKQTFLRFALPITWDFAEANPLAPNDRYFVGAVSSVARVLETFGDEWADVPQAHVVKRSAMEATSELFDAIVTDPPYYDAIPYSDLMDFFYVWLKRLSVGSELEVEFGSTLSPKWNRATGDGELIDDASRHGGDAAGSKKAYEDGMARAFAACKASLAENGKLVVVFAHKQPDAWETLAGALIRAGFVVDASWPIVTEMRGGVRNFGRASLASSVWLVCNVRAESARPGWDQAVLSEMQASIAKRLRDFWDAGVRGPDFVWAATGPGLEAYSKHPVVKKANEPGAILSVSEFLVHVRRMVVDFVIGQVLSGENGDAAAADRLDSPTAYYLLHRHDFGMEEAPAGACILYATACGLRDRDLEATWDLVSHTNTSASDEEDETLDDSDDEAADTEVGSSDGGSKIRLKPWSQRKQKSMGYEAPGGQAVPLIDRIHRLMHLWRSGDVVRVDQYLDEHGLRRQELFRRVLQSLIELSEGDERSLLESISNHVQSRGAAPEIAQMTSPTLSDLKNALQPTKE